MAEHARLAPSSAYVWLRCLGAPNMAANFPDESSFDAAQGNFFHDIAEIVALDDEFEPKDFIGTRKTVEKWEFVFTEEMARHMEPGMMRIREDAAGNDLYIETRVNLERWLGPGQFGTADVGVIFRRERKIKVKDWKYGREPVEPDENEQLMLYALGFWDAYGEAAFGGALDIEIELSIEQPRVDMEEIVWRTTSGELLKFGEYARERAAGTSAPDAPRTAGPTQCKYCPGAKNNACPEYHRYLLEIVNLDFDDLDAPPPAKMPNLSQITPERRSFILKSAAMFRSFLDALHADAYDDALKGRPTPGLKMVKGRRPHRKYFDGVEVEVEELLVMLEGDNAYEPRKLITPTQAEKVIGKKAYASMLEKFVDTGEPSRVLVDDDDPRPALPSALDDFDDLGASEE